MYARVPKIPRWWIVLFALFLSACGNAPQEDSLSLDFPDAKNYKLIDTGAATFNGIDFKWLIETHTNENSNIQMHNYDFVTLKDDQTYILTMVIFSHAFDTVKPLFDKIASSFTWLN